MPNQKIMIYYNKFNKKYQKISECFERNLLSFGNNITVSNSPFENGEDYDIILAIGGDGTVIQALHYSKGTPVLGINMGRKGFLAYCDLDKVLEKSVVEISEKIMNNQYTIDSYSFIKGIVNGVEHCAVNDIVIGKKDMVSTIELEVYIDNEFFVHFIGDGLVISSALGSTAYNRSLGGPVVLGDCDAFILKPMAPINLNIPAIVIPKSKSLKIKVKPRCKGIVGLIGFDGEFYKEEINYENNVIDIENKDVESFNLVVLEGNSYYSNLVKKLS